MAVVTGASSGMGAATARRLAELGAAVAVVARRQEKLEALAADIASTGGKVLSLPVDVTDRACPRSGPLAQPGGRGPGRARFFRACPEA